MLHFDDLDLIPVLKAFPRASVSIRATGLTMAADCIGLS